MKNLSDIGNNGEKTAALMILAYAVLSSTGGVLVKLIPWNAFAIAGYRSLIAGLCVLLYTRFSGTRLHVNRTSLIIGILFGASFVTFILGSQLTSAANAIAIQYTSPVFVLVFSSLLFKERFSCWDIAATVMTIVGIAFFFLDRLDFSGILGCCISLLSGAVLGAAFSVSGNSSEENRINGIFAGHVLVAIIGIFISFLYPVTLTLQSISGVAAMGIFQVGIPLILYSIGARYCPPLVVVLIDAVEPILNPILVYIVVGEQPGKYAFWGAAIVISVVTGWYYMRTRKAALSS